MIFTEHQFGRWDVYADGDDFPNVPTGKRALVGFVGPRGALTVRSRLVPTERAIAMNVLTRARDMLRAEGQLRDPYVERMRADEARNGSFVVELDNGAVRRFSSLRTENAYARGTALYRPGAMDWAADELRSGNARHADIFRAPVSGSARSAIYKPRILRSGVLAQRFRRARGEFPATIVDTYEHEPLQQFDGPRGDYGSTPAIQRAYAVKRQAMDLVDDVIFRSRFDIPPSDIADAWEVAHDAFAEAGLPLQERFAQQNADYWRTRAGVSTRRSANPRKKKRS